MERDKRHDITTRSLTSSRLEVQGHVGRGIYRLSIAESLRGKKEGREGDEGGMRSRLASERN